MFDRIKRDFRTFLGDAPGERFERRFEHSREAGAGWAARLAGIAAGIFFVAIGFVMLFTPGPGLLAIAFGATCLAQESLRLARGCDRLELRIRAWVARLRRKPPR
jgi:hypothetical protein